MRIKIPPPVAALLASVFIWGSAPSAVSLSGESQALFVSILAGCLFLSGCLVIGLALVQFRQEKTTVNPFLPEKTRVLACRGIYRYSRNPMYLGMALILVALGIQLLNPWTVLFVAGFVCFIQFNQILPEEKALGKKFGDEYYRYCREVRPWL